VPVQYSQHDLFTEVESVPNNDSLVLKGLVDKYYEIYGEKVATGKGKKDTSSAPASSKTTN
jgi:hypothetical protein